MAAPSMTANDMRTLLRRDHDEIVQLARDMCESESGDERRALLKQLKPALFAHTRAEQREVYDVLLRRQGDDDAREIAYEGYVAHTVLDDLLERMTKSRKTESDEWKAHSQVLLELVGQHVEKEQARLFDFLTAQYNDDEREAMGRRFVAAKSRLALKAKAA
ncbi:MAG: hemerythrin domain-containing protein [Burkholderiales bacterium]